MHLYTLLNYHSELLVDEKIIQIKSFLWEDLGFLTLSCFVLDELLWECRLGEFEGHPVDECEDGGYSYYGYFWSSAELLVISGDPIFCTVDANTGQLLSRIEHKYTYGLFDVFYNVPIDDSRMALVSTRRICVINSEGQLLKSVDLPLLVKSVKSCSPEMIVVELFALDVDPALYGLSLINFSLEELEKGLWRKQLSKLKKKIHSIVCGDDQ